jgi:hypothetical protein
MLPELVVKQKYQSRSWKLAKFGALYLAVLLGGTLVLSGLGATIPDLQVLSWPGLVCILQFGGKTNIKEWNRPKMEGQ